MARPKEPGWSYEVHIERVGKNNYRSPGQIFATDKQTFQSRRDVLQWMKQNYTTRRGRPMRGKPVYIDTPTGKPKRVGKVFGYWDRYSDNPNKRYFSEDWVSVYRVKKIPGW